MRILYAVEAGEREFELKSLDSDAELRFIFIMPARADSTWNAREEKMIRGSANTSDSLVYNWLGYELHEALQQAAEATNTDLVELLHSSSVLRSDELAFAFVEQVRRLLVAQNRVAGLLASYRAHGFHNYRQLVLDKETDDVDDGVCIGDYVLKAVRPMVMYDWLFLKYCTPRGQQAGLSAGQLIETDFNVVLSDLIVGIQEYHHHNAQLDRSVYSAIRKLVQRKRVTNKSERVQALAEIDEWMRRRMRVGVVFFMHRVMDASRDYETSLLEFEQLFNVTLAAVRRNNQQTKIV